MNKRALILLTCLASLGLPASALAEDATPAAQVPSDASDTLNAAPCISWRNPKILKPKFALLCIHGLGLNSHSYQNFGQRMAANGAIVYAIDVRGFGAWMKAQGHEAIDFEACLKDIQVALQTIQRANPGLPVFILGESMGGAIALRAASLYPDLVDGVISAVPAGDRFKQKKTDLKVALELFEGWHKDHTNIAQQVVDQGSDMQHNGKVYATNEAVKKAWEGDIFDRLDLSPKDLIQFQRFMNENHDCVKKIQDPVLFMLGLDDALVKPDGTWDLAKACTVSDRSVIGLSAPHLVFEVEQAADTKTVKEAVRFLIAWIDVHLPDHSAADVQEPAISAATARAVTQGTPTVVAFYAPWCNQCDRINRFIQNNQARTRRLLRFMQINVDDPANKDIVHEFAVGTLPQIVFLEPDGTITSTILGDTTAIDFAENVNRLIRTGNAGALQKRTTGVQSAPAAAKATTQGQ